MAVRFHPFQKLHRAEGGRALLGAGDDEAERAVMVADQPGGGYKGGDRALHVHRATAMEHTARDLPGERLLRPAMADRHDVSMAGKGKMAAARPTSREQILDRSIGSLAERHTPDLKADALQRRLQDVHRTLVGGGDAGARSEAHTSELQSLMRISYAVFCLKKKNK